MHACCFYSHTAAYIDMSRIRPGSLRLNVKNLQPKTLSLSSSKRNREKTWCDCDICGGKAVTHDTFLEHQQAKKRRTNELNDDDAVFDINDDFNNNDDFSSIINEEENEPRPIIENPLVSDSCVDVVRAIQLLETETNSSTATMNAFLNLMHKYKDRIHMLPKSMSDVHKAMPNYAAEIKVVIINVAACLSVCFLLFSCTLILFDHARISL